jgi:hypothetical protein
MYEKKLIPKNKERDCFILFNSESIRNKNLSLFGTKRNNAKKTLTFQSDPDFSLTMGRTSNSRIGKREGRKQQKADGSKRQKHDGFMYSKSLHHWRKCRRPIKTYAFV